MRWVVGILSIIGFVLLLIAIIDIVSRPTPAAGACALDRQILLPDSCAGNCEPGSFCLALTTRPYGIFLTQAASCVDLCSIRVP